MDTNGASRRIYSGTIMKYIVIEPAGEINKYIVFKKKEFEHLAGAAKYWAEDETNRIITKVIEVEWREKRL